MSSVAYVSLEGSSTTRWPKAKEYVCYGLAAVSSLAAVAIAVYSDFDSTGMESAIGLAGASLLSFGAGLAFTWKRRKEEQTETDLKSKAVFANSTPSRDSNSQWIDQFRRPDGRFPSLGALQQDESLDLVIPVSVAERADVSKFLAEKEKNRSA